MNRDSLNFLGGPWPKAFFAAMSLQAIVGLICEAYIFAMFQTHLTDKEAAGASAATQYKTIPTFLTLFIFGFLYELVLTWDALRLKNTIQIIGLCIANLALLVYTAIQIDQIETAIDDLDAAGALSGSYTTSSGTVVSSSEALWDEIQGPLIAIPIVLAVVTIILSYFAWKLYQAFAWDILKQIGADYRMKKRFLHFQIYIALLKFDFFFFLGFTVQFVVVVGGYGKAEYYATIAAMPLTIVILLAAAYCVRHENKPGSYSIIVLYFGGLAYFIFKLFRIYQHAEQYMPVRKSLTAFAVLAILLIICTIINAFYCINNYGNGLKVHLLKSNQAPEKSDDGSLDMHHLKSTAPTRMTID